MSQIKNITPKLAPSILSANFAKLGEEIATLERAGVHMIHFDVMDGHFVPNLSFGLPVLKSIRPVTKLPFDVHLMIANPWPYLDNYAEAGADGITIHWEAVSSVPSYLKRIRKLGVLPAFAVKPGTPVEDILPAAEWARRILIMSVEPGFGGQELMHDMLRKAEALANFAQQRGLSGLEIEMDGGIDITNVRTVLDSGVNIVVAGSAVIGATPEETTRRVQAFLDIMNQ